jgi:hypothetical protein
MRSLYAVLATRLVGVGLAATDLPSSTVKRRGDPDSR